MHDRPTLHEILDVVQGFLDAEVVAATSGRTQFLARVAANLLRQADRELALEAAHFEASWSGLDSVLGASPRPDERTDRRAALLERLDALCVEIRAGRFDAGATGREPLLGLLRTLVRAKLEVANPALLATDAERGIT